MQLTIAFYPAVNHNYDGNSVEPTNQQGENPHTKKQNKMDITFWIRLQKKKTIVSWEIR